MPSMSGYQVDVFSQTWVRDSHELFDFEAATLTDNRFTVKQSSLCWRDKDQVGHAIDREGLPEGADGLLKLVDRPIDGFWVDRSSPSKKLWMVVKDMPGGSHELTEGDVVKLGRLKLRVRQLSLEEDKQPELRLEDTVQCNALTKDGRVDLATATCRICLLEGPGEDDPLIAPCRCKGTIEYVHLGCLRYWIRGRLGLGDRHCGSYFYRQMTCELCQAVYPMHVYEKGQPRQQLVELPKTEPPFIVLDQVQRDSRSQPLRGLHVLSLKDAKVLKLGRGHESDVRVPDVSLSRCHATIRYTEGKFILEDNSSKFGTVVAMKKPRLLQEGVPFTVQMGRTMLTLTAQKSEDGPMPMEEEEEEEVVDHSGSYWWLRL